MDSKYNTTSLPWRISSDLISAIVACTLVSPMVTIIDKSIILKTSTNSTLPDILRQNVISALRSPGRFFVSAPSLLITLLYFGTYTTANLVDTISSTISNKPADTVTAGSAKFLATTTANMSLCIYKDAKFVKIFGTGGSVASPTSNASPAPTMPISGASNASSLLKSSPSTILAKTLTTSARRTFASASKAASKSVPKTSLILFALRDSCTVFASFNIPPLLGPIIGSQNVAQFLAPASVQVLSTPVHLLGLDLYNRRDERVGWTERWLRIKRDWFVATLARMGRVIPAYGAGGVVNKATRKFLLEMV